MKTTVTATFAALLLAGASTAALAQDHERGAGERMSAQPQPQQQHQQAPHGGGPGGPGGGHWTGAPQPAGMGRPPEHAAPGGEGNFQGRSFQGQAPGSQHAARGAISGARPPHPFDHERGPQEVIPPGAMHAGHMASAQADMHSSPWVGNHGGPAHWQPGHAPPVFWSHDRFHAGPYHAPYGFFVRSWVFGDLLPASWYGQDYWVDDFLDYGLPYPPPGYEWVRVGGDAMMIDRSTGRIVQVVRGIFW